ncbi:MAG: ribosome silencing factor [Candidatus Cloacimonetes bacterium]|nr:ribosome silencing factor [Candidatus Cloacimonadota bacterium]
MEIEHDEAVKKIIEWASDKKSEDLIHIDVKGKTDFTDSIIICHGSAELHIKAIADNIIQKAKEHNIQLLSVEGMENATWVLLDFADIIVHIFSEVKRKYYKLEDLYKITPEVKRKLDKADDKK